MKDAPLYRLARLLRIPRQSTRASFSAPAEREATFLDGSRSLDHPIDRYAPDREEILHKALEAWRIKPPGQADCMTHITVCCWWRNQLFLFT
jgi:hypothetical protein